VRQAEGGLAISRVDVTRTLALALRPEAVSGLDSVTTVVLDVGHGGHDPGALGPFGDEKVLRSMWWDGSEESLERRG
jgi:N-acetylmuramoyl-L-alanine amidase